MNVTVNKLYLYDHVVQLLAVGDNSCFCRGDNGPMSNLTPLKAHRGIDNELIFRVLGPDRIPVDISCNQQVYARIIDPDNRTIVLEKLCRLGPAKGLIKLSLDAGDLALVHAGLYQMVLIRTQDFVVNIPGYYIEKPLYSDLNDNISMEIEITEQAFKAPLDSITLYPEDWIGDILVPTFGPPTPCKYTSRIPGARVLNHLESVHSFSTYTKNFTGILELWGTLEETPDPYVNSVRWFKIYPSTMSQDIEFIGYTGTQAWTFQANFMWLKMRQFPSQAVLDPGIIQKLIVRT
jgi:hypothetical protein